MRTKKGTKRMPGDTIKYMTALYNATQQVHDAQQRLFTQQDTYGAVRLEDAGRYYRSVHAELAAANGKYASAQERKEVLEAARSQLAAVEQTSQRNSLGYAQSLLQREQKAHASSSFSSLVPLSLLDAVVPPAALPSRLLPGRWRNCGLLTPDKSSRLAATVCALALDFVAHQRRRQPRSLSPVSWPRQLFGARRRRRACPPSALGNPPREKMYLAGTRQHRGCDLALPRLKTWMGCTAGTYQHRES
jgi:hypothetical protein